MSVLQVYVEKKPEFAVEAAAVLADLNEALGIPALKSVRVINRYFASHLSETDFVAARHFIFSEPQVDNVYDALPAFEGARVFASEYLPGQFDQRADSCAQCISLRFGCGRPLIRTARIYVLEGGISEPELNKIKSYLINPVECREASLSIPETLDSPAESPDGVETLSGFRKLDTPELKKLASGFSLAMDLDDLRFCQEYFKSENRDPTITELRVIDTYWSDHCRHTTFLTRITSAEIESSDVRECWREYLELREKLYADRDKPVTLMDIATVGTKALKAQGFLKELDESGEINACSVKITVDVDGKDEEWLLQFKNETHNHPTEIEPFGGAATCLGGAIRDPLSGRCYVYQAMRLTGAGDPTETGAPTLPGKLPQRKLVRTAAAGYSSYGNQIGLSTGHVRELYHPGYVAKHMELGAVLGAVPVSNTVREVPEPDDVVILLGGRTGRDGCGGATGSSKSHTSSSLAACGAEVQKGNPPEERKIQRLFRNPEAVRLIRRCNDFGAGGVCVSIGELADGLRVDLDAVPKKYDGLDGTELAISESQERMSVVVSPENAGKFIAFADAENLEATVVASVTESPRLVMDWRGKTIVDLSREFLDSNGAEKRTTIKIPSTSIELKESLISTTEQLSRLMSNLQFCSQKGLVERFDSTIGAGTVLMPFGGAFQLTPAQAMAAKIPVQNGETSTCSVMAWGFSPEISCKSPFHGGIAAVAESVAKVIAAGGTRKKCWLSFQEYFERLGNDPERWGKPVAALLGALKAQLSLKTAAIGGKDSMSGSFEDLDVPPTLVSFAVSVATSESIISPEFKKAGSSIYLLCPPAPDSEDYLSVLSDIFDRVEELISAKKIYAARALGEGGTAVALTEMCFGNHLGFKAAKPLSSMAAPGGFVLEADELPGLEKFLIGFTLPEYVLKPAPGHEIDLHEIQFAWERRLEPVYPCLTQPADLKPAASAPEFKVTTPAKASVKVASPRVLIPVFPGTNCEYDTARAFERAGATTEIFVLRNLSPSAVAESAEAFARLAAASQIIALPGGFSGGDEPDGSAKFITAFLGNPRISDEIMKLLTVRDGLMCGICNGFQALIKLGLVPFGEMREPTPDSPTLTFNTIGRHQSQLVRVKVMSNKSPWLEGLNPGEVYVTPVSHGEGRFIISPELFCELAQNGQIATVYADMDGNPTQDVRFNPNGSYASVEGMLSPDGRVFGKMAHCERYGDDLYKNVPGNKFMDIFSGAVRYYTE